MLRIYNSDLAMKISGVRVIPGSYFDEELNITEIKEKYMIYI